MHFVRLPALVVWLCTMAEEWAYARPYTSRTERAASFDDWRRHCNHQRGHTALKGKSPGDLVPNLRGQNI